MHVPLPRPPSRLVVACYGAWALVNLWACCWLFWWTLLGALRDQTSLEASALGGAGLALATLACVMASSAWQLERQIKIQPLALEDAGDAGALLKQLASDKGLPPPNLGVVVDEAPVSFAYGLSRRQGTIVMSTGLLRLLPTEGQLALAALEYNHLTEGDMVLATWFAGPLATLHTLAELFDGRRRQETAHLAATGSFLGPAARALGWLVKRLLAPYARARMQRAVHGALQTAGGHEPLAQALLVMVEGVGHARSVHRGFCLPAVLASLLPLDPNLAAWLSTAAARQGASGRPTWFEVYRKACTNPWTPSISGDFLHPTPSLAMWPASLAPSQTRSPQACQGDVSTSHTAPLRFEAHQRQQRLPYLLGGLGLLACAWKHAFLGLPFVAWSLGRIFWLYQEWVHWPKTSSLDASELDQSPEGSCWKVQWAAHPVGYGVPGQTWCPDMVLETPVGFLPGRLQHALGSFRSQADAWQVMEGRSDLVFTGLLRKRGITWLEVIRVEDARTTLYASSFLAWQVAATLMIGLLGLLLLSAAWITP